LRRRLRLRRRFAAATMGPRQHHQVAAARGALQQHAMQRDGAHDAALEVRQDARDGGGAEELRDGGEAAPDGAMFDGGGEVAAVFGEDAGDGEDFRDALGHGLAGPIRLGIGRGSKTRGGGCGVHVFHTNTGGGWSQTFSGGMAEGEGHCAGVPVAAQSGDSAPEPGIPAEAGVGLLAGILGAEIYPAPGYGQNIHAYQTVRAHYA